jgi:hypothetical protein
MTDSANSTNPLGFPPWRVGGFHKPTGDEAMSKSSLTRRALVASTAAVPAAAALGLPAAAQAAAEPDPIFALIEEYRQSCARLVAVGEAEAAFEKLHRRPDGSFPEGSDHPELKRLEECSSRACDAQAEVVRKLCHTAPTTLVGLAALLNFAIYSNENGDDFLYTYDNDDPEDGETCLWPFFRTLLQSAEQMARAQS